MRQHDMMDLNKIPISHISIFEAIKQRNADVAIELMRIHLAKGAGRFWQMAKMQHMADEEASDAFNMQNIE